MFNISEELKKLPDKPGVYIMHDANDVVIYVGKAVVLKNRVRQYFQSSRNHTPKIKQMVAHVAWFEYIVVDSEMEALVLECNLIKEHRPKYNTMLKDDKHYPYICVTVSEDYPRLLVARERKKDKHRYFGPYTSAYAVKDTIEVLRKTYFIRDCNRVLPRDIGKERPCIYYHMGQCKGPCMGYVTKEEYAENLKKALAFLEGDRKTIIGELEEKMYAASEEMEFESAARYRDLIGSIKRLSEQQRADDDEHTDRDVVAVATANHPVTCTEGEVAVPDMTDACVQIFFVRDGKMVGRDHYYLTGVEGETKAEILTEFVKQYYSGTPYIPKEI
nr:excinuclease ABC subunit UvrC [Lachnospiraceae bacterium]